jgi:hypothetical protein
LRDPVDRIAEIKAADPNRREAVAFFDVWWAVHGDAPVKATDVAVEVKAHIDTKPVRKEDGSLQYSRQRIARFLTYYAGTHVGGYAFTQLKDPTLKNAVNYYKLQRSTKQ